MNPIAMVCAGIELASGKRIHFSVDSPGDLNNLFDAEEGGVMKSRFCGVAVAALLVSACASSYPDLAKFPAPIKEGPADELTDILGVAVTLQNQYATGYKKTAQWQDYSQLPIIGAATVAAFVLLNDHKNAAKTVGKIGIGAAAYSTTRGQFTAAGLPDIYIAGHGALTCILSEGSYFDGEAADQRNKGFMSQLNEIAQSLQKITEIRYRSVKEGDQAENLKVARAVADQAMAAAQAAEAAALIQESHYLSAAPTFRNAISNVSVRVASKGRVRPSVDYATLRDQMAPPKPPPAPATQESASGGGAKGLVESDDAKTMIHELMVAARDLTASTAKLTAATPDYKKSLDSVAECPKQVG